MITPPPISPSSTTRGSFILFEGIDRCGKTTQCSLLLKHLLSLSIAAVAMRFPDRTTSVGQLINSYLTSSSNNLDDRTIHLLFSANRWEVSSTLVQHLANGKNVICDRYAYSGVAFSSAKAREDRSTRYIGGSTNDDLSIDWCKGPDVGLPAPDLVLFLDLSQEDAEKRGGYGGERYEKRELQLRVRQRFAELQAIDEATQKVPWHIIDASQSIEDVQKEINNLVQQTMDRVKNGKPLYKMFDDGEYLLPVSTDMDNK